MELTFMDIIMDALYLLIPALIGIIIELIRRKLGLETMKRIQVEFELKKDLAKQAVQFAEELYKAGNGDKKLETACKWLSVELGKRGIKADSEEIKGLVLGMLRKLRDEFGKQWGDTITAEYIPMYTEQILPYSWKDEKED